MRVSPGVVRVVALVSMLGAGGPVGCAFVAGGAAVGGAYEYQQHEAMQRLEAEHEAGAITQEEYERRRAEIQRRSVVQ